MSYASFCTPARRCLMCTVGAVHTTYACDLSTGRMRMQQTAVPLVDIPADKNQVNL